MITEQDMKDIMLAEKLHHVPLTIRPRNPDKEPEHWLAVSNQYAITKWCKLFYSAAEIVIFEDTVTRFEDKLPWILLHEIAHVKTFPLDPAKEDDHGVRWAKFAIELMDRYHIDKSSLHFDFQLYKHLPDKFASLRWLANEGY